MSEFDELVSRKGVLVAGRFGPDWRVAEQKSAPLSDRGTTGDHDDQFLLCVDTNAAQHGGCCVKPVEKCPTCAG